MNIERTKKFYLARAGRLALCYITLFTLTVVVMIIMTGQRLGHS